MDTRNSWLFPLMVIAAGSVVAFGCVGIAAITGYIPLSGSDASPLGRYSDPTPVPTDAEVVLQRPVRDDTVHDDAAATTRQVAEAEQAITVVGGGGAAPTLASQSAATLPTESVVK